MGDNKIQKIRAELGAAQLIAVSKYQTIDAVKGLYAVGQRDFGESRAQELAEKHAALPSDINWHFIGHLQTNKVRQVLPFVTCVQSLDSEKLLLEIAKESLRLQRKTSVLFQMKVAQEDTKHGFSVENLVFLLEKIKKSIQNGENTYDFVVFSGIMGMASNTDDENQIKTEFRALKTVFDQLKSVFFDKNGDFQHLSMGMSGDYRLAIAEGSTMVRIGSLLF